MRAELVAIKMLIEMAMSNDIDTDENVSETIVEQLSELHETLANAEKEGM